MRKQTGARLAVKILLIVQYVPVLILFLPSAVAIFDNLIRYFDPAYKGYELSLSDSLFGAGTAAALLTIYFAPSFVAYVRWHANVLPIYIINAVFGWTLIGWVGTLAWAFSNNVIPKEAVPSGSATRRIEPTFSKSES